MELIIGGAYQGKTEYARGLFGNKEISACEISGAEPDFSADIVAHIERFCLNCVREKRPAVAYFQKRRDAWEHCAFIADDISAGVVPVDPEMRAWREETGRLLAYLAGEAKHVHRVFCGIGQVIK